MARVVLSVVVPAHGIAAYLPECLDSILANAAEGPGSERAGFERAGFERAGVEGAGFEIVAVNDASPDACGDLVDDYAGRDTRIRPLQLARNVGLGGARNAGLDAATGEYVWFVDGDDLVPRGAVEAIVDRLRRTRPDVLLLDHLRLRADGRLEADPARPSSRRHVRQAAWNRIVRRSLLDRIGFRFPDGWYEDVAFSHLVLIAARRVEVMDRVCYLYRHRESGAITSTRSARHFEVFAQYDRLFDTLAAWRAGDRARALVFARMIEHYLVILGAEDRLPADLRPAFFARVVEHYRRHLPRVGYPAPGGVKGVKHRFVRWDMYGVFSALRTLYRAPATAAAQVRRRTRPARAGQGRAGIEGPRAEETTRPARH